MGYSEKSIREFLDSLRNGENGTDAENTVSSEKDELTDREFEGLVKYDQDNLIALPGGPDLEKSNLRHFSQVLPYPIDTQSATT